ncbi:LOW QUALITY PROTEIN: hypothetical protein Cgig2_023783 [Carnegiea gigantea]|uniref:Uncharacterized protein n=1 Tax=Carnegiea gigantea TaxID=171969 RepID=A0A9Q1JRA1_9CARY|nr:LOW QUALITY PROTEIN: hypothetical protein Cgig2_023783 [Carnegiea gigantea]
MAFPRSLDTTAISEFVIRRFLWDRRGKASPPSPFPKDFRSLCPDFDLAVAIFYVMLLNEAEKLRVLHGPRFRSLEVALTELRWGAFESWIWLFSDRVYDARFRPKSSSEEGAKAAISDSAVRMAFPPTRSTREMANYGKLHLALEERLAPAAPLGEDFNVLCPYFSLAEAEIAAVESELPEIVQVTFYVMLLNDMLELGAVHEYTVEKMRSLLVGLRWSSFEAWMHIMDPVIQGAQLYHQLNEVEVKQRPGGELRIG